jgi:hypothetical protein
MMPQESLVQPPHIATWLVNLFAPSDQAQAIAGDLLEEFSDIASKSGIASARQWYWRQCVKTVANLFTSGYSAAPWVISCTVLAGLLMSWFIPNWISHALLVITRENGVYVQKNIRFMGSWVHTGLSIITLLEYFLIGCIVAIAAKGREIVATTTLLLAHALFICVVWFWMIEHGSVEITSTNGPSTYLAAIFVIPLYIFAQSISFVAGGLIVRMYRNSAEQRASPVQAHP